MWSLAWPWALAALPLPLLVRKLLARSPGSRSQDAGLRVPNLRGFSDALRIAPMRSSC